MGGGKPCCKQAAKRAGPARSRPRRPAPRTPVRVTSQPRAPTAHDVRRAGVRLEAASAESVASAPPPARSECDVLIVGGGPAGLATALALHRLGWKSMRLVERAPPPTAANPFRAYHMGLPRASKDVLRKLGATAIDEIGLLSNKTEKNKIVLHDGTVVPGTFLFQHEFTDQQCITLVARPELLRMLDAATSRACGDDLTISYNTGVVDVALPPAAGPPGAGAPRLCVTVGPADGGGGEEEICCGLLVGADGVASRVRAALAAAHPERFGEDTYPSGTSGYPFKVLPLPADVELKAGQGRCTHKQLIVMSGPNAPDGPGWAISSLPNASPTAARAFVIARPPDDPIWAATRAEELYEQLERALPQCDWRTHVSRETAESFMASPPGRFSDPRVVRAFHQVYSSDCAVVLVGDAAHCVTPDLGQGAQSALLGVNGLYERLRTHPGDLAAALRGYEEDRLPEARALCRLNQISRSGSVRQALPRLYSAVTGRLRRWIPGLFTEDVNLAIRNLATSVPEGAFPRYQLLLAETFRNFRRFGYLCAAALLLVGAAVRAALG